MLAFPHIVTFHKPTLNNANISKQTYSGDKMPSTSGFDHLFALGISAIFGIYLLRCVAGALLFACAQLPTRWSAVASTCSVRVTPRFARRIAVLVLGLMGIGVAAGPTFATGLPDLDRGPGQSQVAATPQPAPAAQSSPTDPKQRRVRSGDCLWTLAEQQFPSNSTAQVIDRQWHKWYRVNRDRIGANPDLLRTGMWLRVPAVRPTTQPTAHTLAGGVK